MCALSVAGRPHPGPGSELASDQGQATSPTGIPRCRVPYRSPEGHGAPFPDSRFRRTNNAEQDPPRRPCCSTHPGSWSVCGCTSGSTSARLVPGTGPAPHSDCRHSYGVKTTAYDAIRHLRDRGYVTVSLYVPNSPQSSVVRPTDQGRKALAAAQAKLREGTATDFALVPTQPHRF